MAAVSSERFCAEDTNDTDFRISGACEQCRQWRHSLELLEDMQTAQPSDPRELCYCLRRSEGALSFAEAALQCGREAFGSALLACTRGQVLLPKGLDKAPIHFWGLEMAGGLADGAPALRCHVIVLRAEGLISAASVCMSWPCTSEDADICSSAVVACEAGTRFHTVPARSLSVRFCSHSGVSGSQGCRAAVRHYTSHPSGAAVVGKKGWMLLWR